MDNNQFINKKQTKFLFLDGLRGIAAIYVMIGHARWLLWEGYQNFNQHPESYSLINKLLMYSLSAFRWGHEFVLLFFVLSGFVIHNGYCLKLKANPHSKINFGQFFFRRVRRIYPPFLLALILTFALDLIGRMNNFSIYFGTTPYQSLNVNVGNANYELKTFLGNILFLYKDYVPIFGTNGPTWSLKFEWWFYMLYPIFLILSRKHIYYSTALIFILFVASFYPSFWPSQLLQEIFGSMVCWWLGVLLAEVSAKRLPIKMPAFAMMSFLVVILLLFLKNKGATLQDLQTAFLFTFILGILLWLNEKGVNLKFLEKLKPFGDFSYTLYIIHFPILTLLSGVVMKRLNNTLPIHFYFVFGGIAICLFIAYLLHFIVEVPFTKSKPNNTEQNNFFIAGIKRLILR